MTDEERQKLVEELRKRSPLFCNQAAEEIERLAEENAKLHLEIEMLWSALHDGITEVPK